MKYSTAQVAYHWLTLLLLVVMGSTGMAYSFEVAEHDAMWVHQITGQALILVLALRIISRLSNPPRSAGPAVAAWQHLAAQAVHLALYLCLIAYVLTGYVSASAESTNALVAPLSFAFARSDFGELLLETHYILKWVLLGLVGLHVAAALKHHLWDKDTTLTHMTFSKNRG